MLLTFSREWTRGFAPKILQLGCLVIAFLVPTFANAEWQDPLSVPAVQTDSAHTSLLLDITRADHRLVAVGSHGHIVYSDDNGIHWAQAEVPVSVTLTKVYFVSGQIGWAVGHDGVILKTTDAGLSWQLQFDGFKANEAIVEEAKEIYQQAEDALAAAKQGDDQEAISEAEFQLENMGFVLDDAIYDNKVGSTKPFLDVWFYNAHQGYAVGAYGMFFYTQDGGEHWMSGAARIPNPYRYHLNSINMVGSSALSIAGEQGLLIRTDDLGETWFTQEAPYTGSLFGMEAEGDLQLLYGLRGHVYHTTNGGLDWKELQTGSEHTLLGGAVGKKQTLLVGSAGTVLIFDRDMEFVSHLSLEGRKDHSGVVEAVDGTFVLVGEAGVIRIKANGQIKTEVIGSANGELK